MEETQEQSLLNRFNQLDIAAKEITVTLTDANIRHGFFGGYAVTLIGGVRFTYVCLVKSLLASLYNYLSSPWCKPQC